MFKVISESWALVLALVAIVGFLSRPAALKLGFQYAGGFAVSLLALFASRAVLPGHELYTLLGTGLLLLADTIWLAVTFGKAHGVSIFGWLQSHKDDVNKQADLDAATAAAKAALTSDATIAKVAAVQTAEKAAGTVAVGAGSVIGAAVADAAQAAAAKV
jgi:hypothetical protein